MSPEEILEIRARRVAKMAQKLGLIPDAVPHPVLRAELSRREVVGTCADCADGIACHRFTNDRTTVAAAPAFCPNHVLFDALRARFGTTAAETGLSEPDAPETGAPGPAGFALWLSGLSMAGGPGPAEAWFRPAPGQADPASPTTPHPAPRFASGQPPEASAPGAARDPG